MKKIFLLAFLLSFVGCQSINKTMYHVKSAMTGLPRTITLFSANGDTIRQWKGTFYIESDSGSMISWIGEDNKEVKVNGTYIVEQQ